MNTGTSKPCRGILKYLVLTGSRKQMSFLHGVGAERQKHAILRPKKLWLKQSKNRWRWKNAKAPRQTRGQDKSGIRHKSRREKSGEKMEIWTMLWPLNPYMLFPQIKVAQRNGFPQKHTRNIWNSWKCYSVNVSTKEMTKILKCLNILFPQFCCCEFATAWFGRTA